MPEDDLGQLLRTSVVLSNEGGASETQPVNTSTAVELPTDLAQQNRFRIERCVGAGGMGRVYRAWDNRLLRVVALKVIDPGFLNRSPNAIKRQMQQVRACAQLDHENVVRAFETLEARYGKVPLTLPEGMNPENASLIAFAQDVKTMAVLGATRVDLEGD